MKTQEDKKCNSECPICSASAIGKIGIQDLRSGYSEINFECPKCQQKWCDFYERGKYEKSIILSSRPVSRRPRTGMKQDKGGEDYSWFPLIIESGHIKQPIYHCPVCLRPFFFKKCNNIYAVWCGNRNCPSALANEGTKSATLTGAFEKLYQRLKTAEPK